MVITDLQNNIELTIVGNHQCVMHQNETSHIGLFLKILSLATTSTNLVTFKFDNGFTDNIKMY